LVGFGTPEHMAATAFSDAHWISEDGMRLHYRDYPGPAERPAVVCVPGLTRNCRDFAELASRLAPSWRVVALSLRGRGESAYADPSTYNNVVYVQDLESLALQLELTRVVIIGTSLGARLAMMLAARHPDLIAGAVLNDLGPITPPEALARIRSSLSVAEYCWCSWNKAAEALATRFAALHPRYRREDWMQMARRLCRESGDGDVRLDYDPRLVTAPPSPSEDLWLGLHALSAVPVLSVRGSLSDVLTAEGQNELCRRIASLETACVTDTGHAPTLGEPAAIAAVDRLLERVLAAERRRRAC
jgi:pimeloyl-ACP methyl ester carboxylesterase